MTLYLAFCDVKLLSRRYKYLHHFDELIIEVRTRNANVDLQGIATSTKKRSYTTLTLL